MIQIDGIELACQEQIIGMGVVVTDKFQMMYLMNGILMILLPQAKKDINDGKSFNSRIFC
jgi:hypothetical protein